MTGTTAASQPSGPADPVTVTPPKHPVHALTTYELRDYRRQLESAIAFFYSKDPVPPARSGLQARLDAVTAEEEDRKRLAEARPNVTDGRKDPVRCSGPGRAPSAPPPG
ncbi:MAG TPA: hypothetical protein VIX15_01745 [Streptosporangiaceae bacterium]